MLEQRQILLVQHSDKAVLPTRATYGSFGYDIVIPETTLIPAHPAGPTLVDTGWSLAHDLPAGLAMLILPRSSLYMKYGLIVPNSPGLVDQDYAGPLKVMVQNLTAQPVILAEGTRIAQFVFVECALPYIQATQERNPSRTRGGFGSTGT
jgi:dUTP pyrophosphatase